METIDWLWILHPTLAVVLIYPLIGVVVRLGIQTKARRVDGAKLPPATGSDHADLGRWLSAGVVAISLVALALEIATHAPPSQFPGGAARACQLLLVLVGTVVALIMLWRATEKATRLAFALITWAGVISLGAQPEVSRLSDNPFQAEFWQSHYWAGVGLMGLMLFSLGARPEILRELPWRRLHVSANILAVVLFVLQGMTGSRNLLVTPLHWQKGTLEACNSITHLCPAIAPTDHPGRSGS